MKQIIINIKDQSKLSFLMQLISQLDFVEVETIKKKKSSKEYNFFDSTGMWANKQVNAKDLRKQAWDRTK
jgi:hypothetical protein